jgi:hypothetical protein
MTEPSFWAVIQKTMVIVAILSIAGVGLIIVFTLCVIWIDAVMVVPFLSGLSAMGISKCYG